VVLVSMASTSNKYANPAVEQTCAKKPRRPLTSTLAISMTTPASWDVFICHASEDKEHVARPLARELEYAGLRVWYDEFILKVGDSLNESISQGLANSKFGVVILSSSFIRQKKWTNYELNSLFALEEIDNKRILPVWHNVGPDQLTKFNPALADRVAVSTSSGIASVAKAIVNRLNIQKPHIEKPAIPDIEWLARVFDFSRKSLAVCNDGLWWDIVDQPKLFESLDRDFLDIFFSELRAEEYKLSWCDDDKDIGVFDSPDMLVVEETINYLKLVINEIPYDKRDIAFNFIINAASCGRGLQENGLRERMRKRIHNCFLGCIKYSFDVDKLNASSEAKSFWSDEITS